MYPQHPPGFILLLTIFIWYVAPAHWDSQGISGTEDPVEKSSAYKQQYVFPGLLHPHLQKSSLYEYQHVFSGFWQLQHLHKAVYLRHFGKEGSQQISIHGNNFPQQEKYDFSR